MQRIFLLILLAWLPISLWAQTVLENNPSRLKWNRIDTQHFRILFPQGFELQGQRMANTLQHIHDAEAKSLGSKPRKVSIVLQNQSSISNGFVSVLPRRSEFFTMPAQNTNFSGTNDWLNMLASHEYRHIVQYQHATRGVNKVLYYLFGATTFAAMSQAVAPKWFWEGDAVATETAFTHSGRGRIPNFGLAFRSNLMEGRVFDYHKQYVRSYKHFIPDHYVLGYHMISYLRKRSNDGEIWGKITGRAWNVPFIPFRFSSSIKKETGLYVSALYREMVKDLTAQWQAEQSQLQLTSFEKINARKNKAYTDYLYPQVMDDGSIVVMKQGIGDIARFVRIDGGEEKIFTPGILNDTGIISSGDSSLVWNEYGFSPRWGVKNYSLIKTYHTKSRKKRVIGGKHNRYAGSALSPDGSRVVTVRSGNDYQTSLVILDFKSGKTIKEFPNPENDFFSMPRWSPDSKTIVVLKTQQGRRSVVSVDAESGSVSEIIPPGVENVGYPVLTEKFLLFNSPISGIDNIYAIDLQSRKRYQVTSSKYGSYNPAMSNDGKTIYYNNQSRDGMDVVKIQFEPTQWKEYTTFDHKENELVANLVEQEGRPHLFDSIPQQKLPVKRYSKLKGIINPYSWGIYTDENFAQAEFGIASQDILSTTRIDLGLTYDVNEKTLSRKVGVSYQGWFPIIDFQYLAGNREVNDTYFGNPVETVWKESTFEGGLRIPLTLTSSKYLSQLTVGNHVGMTQVSDFVNTVTRNDVLLSVYPQRFTNRYYPIHIDTISYIYIDKGQISNGSLAYNRFSLSYYNLLKRSHRDFLYKWGQTLDIESYNALNVGDFNGSLWAIRSTLYFPGFFKHHFLYSRIGFQKSRQGIETNLYTFRNRIPKPRGHSFPSDETFFSFSANYALPLWYPDLRIGPFLDVQRIRLNLFYDYGKGNGHEYYYSDFGIGSTTSNTLYQSLGVETMFDFNVMRFLPQFNVGFRTTYAFANPYTNSGIVFEFLIGNIGF